MDWVGPKRKTVGLFLHPVRLARAPQANYGPSMISKSDFIAVMQRGGMSLTGHEPELKYYDIAVEAAVKARAAMPGIGFLSIRQRYNAFVAVCRHFEAMVEQGEIETSDAELALTILRLSHKPFTKAAVAFDIRGSRLDALARSELPAPAFLYLMQTQKRL